MERNYETIVIVKPEVGEADLKGIIKSAGTAIDGGGGRVERVDEWGRKRLAYPIAKKNEGYYVLFDYSGSPASVKAIERFFKFNEEVLRYQTVKVDSKETTLARTETPAPVEEAAAGPVEDTPEAAPEAPVEETAPAPPAEGVEATPVEEAAPAEGAAEDKGGENG